MINVLKGIVVVDMILIIFVFLFAIIDDLKNRKKNTDPDAAFAPDQSGETKGTDILFYGACIAIIVIELLKGYLIFR